MAALISPQPLVVGESSSKPKESSLNPSKPISYAAQLNSNSIVLSSSKTILKPVEIIHGIPTLQFTIDERQEFAKEEGLHQAIVVKLSTGAPDLATLRTLLPKNFGFKGHCLIGLLAPRQLLLRLDQHDDYVNGLTRSVTYYLHQGREHQVRVFPWSIGFNPNEETTKAVVWISLPNLPPDLFAKKALLSIASAVGKPIAIDKATQIKSRPSTARVRVILDLMDKLPEKVRLQYVDSITGKIIEELQEIIYDNLPSYCFHCKHQGHKEIECRLLKGKQIAVPLDVHVEPDDQNNEKLQGDARDFLNAKKQKNMDLSKSTGSLVDAAPGMGLELSKNGVKEAIPIDVFYRGDGLGHKLPETSREDHKSDAKQSHLSSNDHNAVHERVTLKEPCDRAKALVHMEKLKPVEKLTGPNGSLEAVEEGVPVAANASDRDEQTVFKQVGHMQGRPTKIKEIHDDAGQKSRIHIDNFCRDNEKAAGNEPLKVWEMEPTTTGKLLKNNALGSDGQNGRLPLIKASDFNKEKSKKEGQLERESERKNSLVEKSDFGSVNACEKVKTSDKVMHNIGSTSQKRGVNLSLQQTMHVGHLDLKNKDSLVVENKGNENSKAWGDISNDAPVHTHATADRDAGKNVDLDKKDANKILTADRGANFFAKPTGALNNNADRSTTTVDHRPQASVGKLFGEEWEDEYDDKADFGVNLVEQFNCANLKREQENRLKQRFLFASHRVERVIKDEIQISFFENSMSGKLKNKLEAPDFIPSKLPCRTCLHFIDTPPNTVEDHIGTSQAGAIWMKIATMSDKKVIVRRPPMRAAKQKQVAPTSSKRSYRSRNR